MNLLLSIFRLPLRVWRALAPKTGKCDICGCTAPEGRCEDCRVFMLGW